MAQGAVRPGRTSWLPKRIEAAVSAYDERHGVTDDQPLAQQLTPFALDAASRHPMAALAGADTGGPEHLAGRVTPDSP